MNMVRNAVDTSKFNPNSRLPYELRLKDFEMAMQDVYDFFFDVNSHLAKKGLQRLDDMLRPAIMSGVLSDMLTASLAKHLGRSQKTNISTVIQILSSRAFTWTTLLKRAPKALR